MPHDPPRHRRQWMFELRADGLPWAIGNMMSV
jgi:hypothetical protein